MHDTQKCLICRKHNETVYWHIDKEQGSIWCWCNGCGRAYSLYNYCYLADIPLKEFLRGDFNFIEDKPNEVQKMLFPNDYVPMSDPRAQDGRHYVASRGLSLRADWYYDTVGKGIVFPYYFQNIFVGAQTRYIKERIFKDGSVQKIGTLPGTRLGLLFYGWAQQPFVGQVKGVIVTEGAFNAISINQALEGMYGSIMGCPFRCVAASGSGASNHQREVIKELKDQGFKIIVAPDFDEAGVKMLKKFVESEAITHYAFTGNENRDWNDVLKEMGHEKFAKWFLGRVTRVGQK